MGKFIEIISEWCSLSKFSLKVFPRLIIAMTLIKTIYTEVDHNAIFTTYVAQIKLICKDYLNRKSSASDGFDVLSTLEGILVITCIGVLVGLQDLAIGDDLDQDAFE